MLNRVIVALDNMTLKETHQFLDKAKGIEFVKVGMELFYSQGREALIEIYQKYGVKIFLDLKLHDIPNTVAKAVKSLEGLPIEFLTIHCVGGPTMISKAMEMKNDCLPNSKILGVSYLTSMSDDDFSQIYSYQNNEIQMAFSRLFKLGISNKIDGFILSGHELAQVNSITKQADYSPLKVCPGIRFEDEIASGATQDQSRVMSPEEAFKAGADYLVMGRSLTKASNIEMRLDSLKNL